jgi:hypothetical protein
MHTNMKNIFDCFNQTVSQTITAVGQATVYPGKECSIFRPGAGLLPGIFWIIIVL